MIDSTQNVALLAELTSCIGVLTTTPVASVYSLLHHTVKGFHGSFLPAHFIPMYLSSITITEESTPNSQFVS